MPHLLPGALHPSNKSCIDWNCFGAIAYGSHNSIFIVDAFSLRRVQTIVHHEAAVNKVKWAPPASLTDSGKNDGSRIASSDISGQIIVTEVLSAMKRAQFSVPSTDILAMEWFAWKDVSRDFLLVLHSGNQLILWNADSGDKIWAHSYTHSLFDMVLDPFNIKHAAFSSSGNSLVLVRDLHLGTEPFSNGYLATLAEDPNKETSIECIVYHKAYRNSLFLLINEQLILFDTDLCATLLTLPVDSSTISINICSQRDALFTVCMNGTVTLRKGVFCSNDDRAETRFDLQKVSSLDTFRHGSHQKVVACSLCPVTQSTLAVLYGSGRLVFYQLALEGGTTAYRQVYIEDCLDFDHSLSTTSVGSLRLYQSGFVGALSNGVTCIRVRPMDGLGANKDDLFAESELGSAHIAAIGTHAGIVHLVNVFSRQTLKEFNVQSSPVRCLEWGGPYTILTAGYSHALSTTQIVRNDLFATDIRTGSTRRVRPEADESPITIMRVSYYHCYLALAFQREPLEIWDLKGMRLLRRMSKACPLIIDMAWSSKHHEVKTTENGGRSIYKENLVVLDSENRLYHVIVKGLHVKDGNEVNTSWKNGGWSIRNMAWKDDMLVMGDLDGRIAVWDLGKRRSKNVRSSRLPVMRMAFSRLAGDHTLAVLHQRELILWDTEALTKVSHILIDSSRAALDMDLCGVAPLLLTSDNVFHFSPSEMASTAIAEKDIPILMNEHKVEQICHEFDSGQFQMEELKSLSEKKIPAVQTPGEGDDVDLTAAINEGMLLRFLGDLYGYQLLLLARDVLQPSADLQLPPVLQMFWPSDAFRERELRVTCAAAAASNVLESRLVERAVVAGGKAKDRVVDRLIGSNDLRHASMKAALLVSSQESEQAKSLIKLIATNLIASDMIEDGVELLFLVGAGADACKYLQSQKQWNKSIVYAKMGLDNPEEVFSKWIAHLQNTDKARYVLAEVSRGEWPTVVEQLSSAGRSRLARLILRTTTSSPPSTERTSPAVQRHIRTKLDA